MIRFTSLAMITFFLVPLSASAQQSSSKLTDKQRNGRRIFEQRCAICHTPPTVNSKLYGPALYKDVIDGNEDTVRQFIMYGQPNQMPGFRYGLDSSEIDEIIDYLKTVQKPAKAKGTSSGTGTID
jgi:mono/diheme cytochrome c family protein